MGNGNSNNNRNNNVKTKVTTQATELSNKLSALQKNLATIKGIYNTDQQIIISLNKQGDEYKSQIEILKSKIQDGESQKDAQMAILHNEQNILELSKKINDDENTYTDLAQTQFSYLSGEDIKTNQDTGVAMKNMYENIKEQNKQLYGTIQKLNEMFSTDQSKTMYLKGKTSTWDTLLTIFFVVYYLMYFVLGYILYYMENPSMTRNVKVLYMLFFLLMPTFVGVYTSFFGSYYPFFDE